MESSVLSRLFLLLQEILYIEMFVVEDLLLSVLCTLFVDELLYLLVQVLSPSHQRVAPLLPQYTQVFVLITV